MRYETENRKEETGAEEMKEEETNLSGCIALEKSFAFALRIVKLYQHLYDKRKEFVLSKQILRSGTSIGANWEESRGAQSSADFQAKISIAYKEARETSYWLRLLFASKYITERQFSSIYADCEELLCMLSATQHTMKKKLQAGGRGRQEREGRREKVEGRKYEI